MKLHHVRTVAVIAVVLVALTGARKSDGGSCGGNSHRSDHSDGSDGNAASGGGIGGNGNRDRAAASDVSVTRCAFDSDSRSWVAELRVKNGAASARTYRATVEFQDQAGHALATAQVTNFQVAARQTFSTVATTGYTGSGDGSELVRCAVKDVTKR